ncbi:MAG TPA: hypothetical protein VGE51_06420 [Fontimonas sp.]
MLRIYDESQFRSRTRLKRLQVLVLFAAGTLSGAWISSSGGQWPLLQDAFATDIATQRPANALQPQRTQTLRACAGESGHGLRLDCQLSLPQLPRAEGL